MRKRKEEKKEDFFHYMKIIIAILAVAFLILACYFGYRFGRMVFSDASLTNSIDSNRTYLITVEAGESALSIGMELEKNGIIESGLAFFVQTKVYACKIAPGTYEVSSKMSSKSIAKYFNTEYSKAKQSGGQ